MIVARLVQHDDDDDAISRTVTILSQYKANADLIVRSDIEKEHYRMYKKSMIAAFQRKIGTENLKSTSENKREKPPFFYAERRRALPIANGRRLAFLRIPCCHIVPTAPKNPQE
jgi:hypothetical protein